MKPALALIVAILIVAIFVMATRKTTIPVVPVVAPVWTNPEYVLPKKQDKVRMSSTYTMDADPHPAGNCYDDDLGTICHTENEPNAWIEIDLERDIPVKRIHIYNRTDCCSDRIVPALVTLKDDAGQIVWSEKITEVNSEYDFPVQEAGRFLRIELQKTDFLHIRDIDVISVH